MFRFVLKKSAGPAGPRLGELHTAHGIVETPAFMPVGTYGTVKTMTPEELMELGAQIILGNVYHLFLRPGVELIAGLGGLGRFMNWPGPILTDSGGYQIFSLAQFRQISEEGVLFRSHLNGDKHFLTPEKVVALQEALGVDIMMCLDECPPFPSPEKEVRRAADLTYRWAARSLAVWNRDRAALFAIVQGGMLPEWRREQAQALRELDFSGYALGGLSVGEDKDTTFAMAEAAVSELPQDKPRYLMGMGLPEDLVEGAARGVDMFDCVIPTRNARNGQVFTEAGALMLRNAEFARDPEPISSTCGCYTCRHYSRAYLRHLFMCREILAYRLLTLHNLYYYFNLMAQIRDASAAGRFAAFRQEFYRKRQNGGKSSG
ncbi:MAG: tRNA guanosine(34) transglycosylase Tgt [Deltaproteobacteria bacterium]|nr:tRNA guanosine(34) transglycosylase Tgt [Deltaproteobacteria bacterium]